MGFSVHSFTPIPHTGCVLRRLLLFIKSKARRLRYQVSNIAEQTEEQTVTGQDAFRLRMLEQIRQIGRYRQDVLRDTGRLLTPEEAAREWIDRYAASFGGNKPLS